MLPRRYHKRSIRPSSYQRCLSNGKYAFIKDKYEDTNKHLFGCDFPNADYAKIAEAQGAVGFTVDRIEDIDAVVAEAVKLNKKVKLL